jgi:hypothetical protein
VTALWTRRREFGERRLEHGKREAEKFYRSLQQTGVSVRVGKRPRGIHVGLSRFRPRGCGSKRPIAAPTIKNVCAVPRAVEGHRRFAHFGQKAKLTFGTWHLIVSFWLLGAPSPYAAVRAQIPPANISASSLDLTLHVHPDSLTQPGISFGTYSTGDGADCDHRRESESTSKSDPGTTTPSIPANTSDPLSPTPPAKTCPATSTGGAPQYTEGFNEKIHWGPILKQSLGFLVFEHTFRIANDRYARHLLWHKPFWEDYIDSLQHFDMGRWGDGDDFLVNYIGHPLQGSVTGNIFIQNDPHGRSERFGKSGAYWKSRFRAMLYAAAYSTYFEAGPVLSEAALGNEGGYVYVPKCGLAPCSIPGRHLKPPTNNTGWVDFVITPTVGTGWIVMEDAIAAKIVDPLAGNSQSLTWKIVRGSLAPSRTMANFLQGKLPWYRPWLYENATGRAGNLIVPSIKPKDPSEASLWRDQPRKAIGIHYVNLSLPMDWQGCYKCRVNNSGVGATISYRMTNHFWFDSEVNQFPGSGSSKGSGSATEGLFGIRYGYTGRVWNVYVKARPGFIYYPKTTSFPTGHEFASLSRFALDCGGIIEMKASKRSLFRFDAGTTFVRYLQGLDPRQAPVAYISPTYIATQGNFQVATGYVFRF